MDKLIATIDNRNEILVLFFKGHEVEKKEKLQVRQLTGQTSVHTYNLVSIKDFIVGSEAGHVEKWFGKFVYNNIELYFHLFNYSFQNPKSNSVYLCIGNDDKWLTS